MSNFYPQLPSTNFPDSIQTFTTFLDITVSDGKLIQQYQAAMQDGDLATAQEIYAQIPNASQKIINAQKLNTIINTCEALENFYKTDVQPYVTDKQAEWQAIIDLFAYKGGYNTSTTYYKNNLVTYTSDGVEYVYIAVSNPPVGTVPTNTIYWRVLSIRGEKGASGSGMAFIGEWSSSESYSANNIVTYGNYVWASTQASTNQTPSDTSSYWVKIGDVRPSEIPIQVDEPTGQETGDLWFKVIE